MYRKIIAVFMAAMVVATTCVVPSFATDYQSTYNFWNWLYDNGGFVSKSIASSADSVCSLSDDGLHHSTQHQKRAFTGEGRYEDEAPVYDCICDVCGQTFEAVATDLANSYDDGSDGYDSIDSNGRVYASGEWTTWYHTFVETGVSVDSPTQLHVTVTGTSNTGSGLYALCYLFTVPYDCTVVFDGAFERVNDDGSIDNAYKGIGLSSASSPTKCALSTSFVDGVRTFSATGGVTYRYTSGSYSKEPKTTITSYFNIPRIYIQLDDPISKYQEIPVYGGGNLSFSVDGGTQYKNIEFINTETNTFYNPVTDNSQILQSWNYDYDNRTYTGYTENGEVKVVYGDEYISVVEGGNTYNYYYASPTDGSGSGSGGDSSGDDDGEGLFGKIGELLGTLLGGLLDLVTGVLSGILDSLISLVEMTIEKLGSVVNLFGSFGDALRALWSWLPEDIITILSAGVSVVIFAAVLKLFI